MVFRSSSVLALAVCFAGEAAAFAPSLPTIHAAGRSPTSSVTSLRCAGAAGETSRRTFLSSAGTAAAAIGLTHPTGANAASAGPKLPEEFWDEKVKSGQLRGRAYQVLHNADTERPNTSPLLKENREGIFSCAACGTPAYSSKTKFNSGTGWPSFYEKLEGVELETGNKWDNLVGMRSEVHCVKCGGHQGHVFDDGIIWKVPTGKRYCINGLAITFTPGKVDA